MRLDVVDLNSKEGQEKYNKAILSINKDHPYYSLEFIDTFSYGLKDAFAYIGTKHPKQGSIVMPFYYRKIPMTKSLSLEEELYDISSTYGYSGPLFDDRISKLDLHDFWSKVDTWHIKNNVVSEFIRFNLTGNSIAYSGTCIATMKNIKGKLVDPEIAWNNYEAKVRKNVRRAEKEGLVVNIYFKSISIGIIDSFYDIYIDTMKRVGTNKEFYFDKSKIHDFINVHSDNCLIAMTEKDGQPISTEFVLLSKTEMYSFLGGTYNDFFKYRPNDLLKHELIKWGFKHGFTYYVLGGGFGKEDGIYRYKKSFFPEDITTYYTGRKVVRKDYYNILTNNRSHIELNDLGINKYFPAYRISNNP